MNQKSNLKFNEVEQVIKAFGGLRPMATALGVPVSTVQGWKERNAIPKARHGEVQQAFAALSTPSHIPVDHAIDAAAEMIDAHPLQADTAARAYHPPRSQGTAPPSRPLTAGGSNLILSLILLLLFILSGTVAYLLFFASPQQAKAGDLVDIRGQLIDITDRLTTLQDQQTSLNQEIGTLSDQWVHVSDALTQLSQGFAGLEDVRTNLTTLLQDAEDLSEQVSELANSIAEQEEATSLAIENLSLSQTGLFEVMSQKLLAQMETLSANMDEAITQQIERLQATAEAAAEDARVQRERADTSDAELADANARALSAEQALARGIDHIVTLVRLRLALAENEPFGSDFMVLAQLSDQHELLTIAYQSLAPYANGPLADEGMPALIDLKIEIDRLIKLDRDALNHSNSFGISLVPNPKDLSSNQGKLNAAQAALMDGDFVGVGTLIASLEGIGAEETGPLLFALRARIAADISKAALDQWIDGLINP